MYDLSADLYIGKLRACLWFAKLGAKTFASDSVGKPTLE
jgi:hypothetical protein